MNKFTLKFLNPQLELQYQEEQIVKIRKRVFYLFMALGLILNVTKVLLDLIHLKPSTQLINYILIGLAMTLVPISLKWPLQIKYTLMIANISTGLLQMNFGQETQPQVYYTYGSSFMEFQACAYFVSDFLDSVIQVASHTIMRVIITTYYTKIVDPQDILMGIGAAIIISIVIYICDSNSRNKFLHNICENIWDQQLPELIQKPYISVSYSSTLQHYNMNNCYEICQFPNYDEGMCEGCNTRNFLRMFKTDEFDLYTLLQENRIGTFRVQSLKIKFQLLLVNLGIDNSQKLIILNSLPQSTQTLQTPIKRTMNHYFKQSINKHQQLFFNWGMQSLLLIRDFSLQEIFLYKLMKKFIQVFEKPKKIHFLLKGDDTITLTTYGNQLKIYLIQLFLILTSLLEQYRKLKKKQIKLITATILVYREKDNIVVQLPNTINQFIFLNRYQKNIFIQQVEESILNYPLSSDLKIVFSKNLPFRQ